MAPARGVTLRVAAPAKPARSHGAPILQRAVMLNFRRLALPSLLLSPALLACMATGCSSADTGLYEGESAADGGSSPVPAALATPKPWRWRCRGSSLSLAATARAR